MTSLGRVPRPETRHSIHAAFQSGRSILQAAYHLHVKCGVLPICTSDIQNIGNVIHKIRGMPRDMVWSDERPGP